MMPRLRSTLMSRRSSILMQRLHPLPDAEASIDAETESETTYADTEGLEEHQDATCDADIHKYITLHTLFT